MLPNNSYLVDAVNNHCVGQSHEKNTMIPIVLMTKLRFKELMSCVQGHTGQNGEGGDRIWC